MFRYNNLLYLLWEYKIQPPALSAGGKSGLRRAGCRIISCECELRESATEIYRPRKRVRVKRWGKSPPAERVTFGPGKPHPEQGRIGEDEAAR